MRISVKQYCYRNKLRYSVFKRYVERYETFDKESNTIDENEKYEPIWVPLKEYAESIDRSVELLRFLLNNEESKCHFRTRKNASDRWEIDLCNTHYSIDTRTTKNRFSQIPEFLSNSKNDVENYCLSMDITVEEFMQNAVNEYLNK